jgi:hypothetical protein
MPVSCTVLIRVVLVCFAVSACASPEPHAWEDMPYGMVKATEEGI